MKFLPHLMLGCRLQIVERERDIRKQLFKRGENDNGSEEMVVTYKDKIPGITLRRTTVNDNDIEIEEGEKANEIKRGEIRKAYNMSMNVKR